MARKSHWQWLPPALGPKAAQSISATPALLTLPQGPGLGSAQGFLPHGHRESLRLLAPVDKDMRSFSCQAPGNGQRPLCRDAPGPSIGEAGKALPQRPSEPCKGKRRERRRGETRSSLNCGRSLLPNPSAHKTHTFPSPANMPANLAAVYLMYSIWSVHL